MKNSQTDSLVVAMAFLGAPQIEDGQIDAAVFDDESLVDLEIVACDDRLPMAYYLGTPTSLWERQPDLSVASEAS